MKTKIIAQEADAQVSLDGKRSPKKDGAKLILRGKGRHFEEIAGKLRDLSQRKTAPVMPVFPISCIDRRRLPAIEEDLIMEVIECSRVVVTVPLSVAIGIAMERERLTKTRQYRDRQNARRRERYRDDPEYRENRDRQNARRRERYRDDPEYRERRLKENREHLKRSKEYRLRKKQEAEMVAYFSECLLWTP